MPHSPGFWMLLDVPPPDAAEVEAPPAVVPAASVVPAAVVAAASVPAGAAVVSDDDLLSQESKRVSQVTASDAHDVAVKARDLVKVTDSPFTWIRCWHNQQQPRENRRSNARAGGKSHALRIHSECLDMSSSRRPT